MTTIPQPQHSNSRDHVRGATPRDGLPAVLPRVLRAPIVSPQLHGKHGLPTPAALICGYLSPVTQRYVRRCVLIPLESSASLRWTDDEPDGAT